MSRYSEFIERHCDNYHNKIENLRIYTVNKPNPELDIQMLKAVSFDGSTEFNVYFQQNGSAIYIIKDNLFAEKKVEMSSEDIVKKILSKPFLSPGIVLQDNELYSVYKNENNEFVVEKV